MLLPFYPFTDQQHSRRWPTLASAATVNNQMRVNTPRPSPTSNVPKRPRIVSINVNKQMHPVRVPAAQTTLAVPSIPYSSTLPQSPPWLPPPLLVQATLALHLLLLAIHSQALEGQPPRPAIVLPLPVSRPLPSVSVANTVFLLSLVV